MKNSNILKYIIPVVAVLVIAESVYLVNSMISKRVEVPEMMVENSSGTGEDYIVEPNSNMEKIKMGVGLVGEATEYKVGDEVEVKVVMVSREDLLVDAINYYVSFDPTMVSLSDLMAGEGMPKPTFDKISDKKDVVVMNYYVEGDGLKIDMGNEIVLGTFKAKLLKEGEVNFDLSTGNEDKDSATMIVENGTSEAIPFSVNNLRFEVIK